MLNSIEWYLYDIADMLADIYYFGSFFERSLVMAAITSPFLIYFLYRRNKKAQKKFKDEKAGPGSNLDTSRAYATALNKLNIHKPCTNKSRAHKTAAKTTTAAVFSSEALEKDGFQHANLAIKRNSLMRDETGYGGTFEDSMINMDNDMFGPSQKIDLIDVNDEMKQSLDDNFDHFEVSSSDFDNNSL